MLVKLIRAAVFHLTMGNILLCCLREAAKPLPSSGFLDNNHWDGSWLRRRMRRVMDAAGRGISGTWLDQMVGEMFWFQQVTSSEWQTENVLIWAIVLLHIPLQFLSLTRLGGLRS